MVHSSSHGIDGILYVLIGGPILLFWGLRKLNEKRLIENTPCSKVRSAAIGRVELSGLARQRKPQKSPMTHMESCWWDCQVQDLQSDGKNSRWVTIKSVNSMDLFYLDDTTGRVLVNPFGAELHVLTNTFDLNSGTRTMMAPVLNSWGINDLNWIGLERRLRVVESLIPDCAPLYVLGELSNIGGHLDDRQQRFTARLRAVKADPAKMAEADVNHDGTVDAEEWDAFRTAQENDFLKEEMARQAQMPNQDNMIIARGIQGPFVVSTQEERELISSFKWLAPIGIFGGIAVSALGVWLALLSGWNLYVILGALAIGFVVGLVGKSINVN